MMGMQHDGTAPIDFGRRIWRWSLARGRWAGRIDVRAAAVTTILLLALLAGFAVALVTGDFAVSPAEVLDALGGGGTPAQQKVVRDWRLPRALMACVIGAGLGVSGAIFQSLTRNPLGSPDIIGFHTGAYTGALVSMLVLEAGFAGTAVGALLGGGLTAIAVYILSSGRGSTTYRMIIVGIGIGAMLSSVNTWLILTSELRASMSAATWGVGTLANVEWEQALPVLWVCALLVVPTIASCRLLVPLSLGDDVARSLGVNVRRARVQLVAVAVCLVAVGTTVAGAIGFVALVAPQIARRLLRTDTSAWAVSALTGAVLLLVSDVIAQRLVAPLQLPVGLVTISIGGAYLAWLLLRTAVHRKERR